MTYHLVVDEARYSHRVAPIELLDIKHFDAYCTYRDFEDQTLFEMLRRAIQNDLTPINAM